MSFLDFNSMLLDISNKLSSKELEEMKFLCREIIGKKNMEQINSALNLFQFLSERGKLAADRTEFLSKLLKDIQRPGLSEIVENFQGKPDDQLEPTERDRLNIATEVIAENLSKNWRKLGRKLGLSEVKLESISKRHPTDIEETVVEMLKEWRIHRGAEARTIDLLEALRACQYNLTADKVEEKLAQADVDGQ
ncbi:FAS-associated death domain protein [Cynoglossus semilaevis]|uniref:Fas associated via death domain n=1 Tax=Cynoglossus semilaevis TaxID=244447 RepID=A0A3P8WV41_CYNSE|nr:FAS-associated death domain protein [Cynoglossus semilaevis]